MRADLAGMFWDDTPPPKVSKLKEKREPPEPIWESPDYLPNIDEARAFVVPAYPLAELSEAADRGDLFGYDVESYPNFWCVSFQCHRTGRVIYFEDSDYETFDRSQLTWMLENLCIYGFNSNAFDIYSCELAAGGADFEELFWATEQMIKYEVPGWKLLRAKKQKRLKVNHIDLIEVAPLSANLKTYGGRLFAPRLQDLPFVPGTVLTRDQQLIVKLYNVRGDLQATAYVMENLKEQVKLRASMSAMYGIDLRSKSDAQIAEAVIGSEVRRITGKQIDAAHVGAGFYYQPPSFLSFQTNLLDWVFKTVASSWYELDEGGVVVSPPAFRDEKGKAVGLQFTIGDTEYTVGLGGLHSREKGRTHYARPGYRLLDRDVTSYYPRLIINSGMFPPQLGPAFCGVYADIINARIAAKRAKDKVKADALKITGNGTFGKLGSPFSILYAPHLLLQITLTGQLSLLMLIEAMELAGIRVISANTDGVVMEVPDELYETYLQIIKWWEQTTQLETEETEYRALHSRDVNNYIAVKTNGTVKSKGVYLNAWADPDLAIFRFHKNPVNLICTEAVEAYVTRGVHPVDTIHACDDVRKFSALIKVKGGGVFLCKDEPNLFLGKTVRWYYADAPSMIVYASSGNMVPRSEGARPLMDLPDSLPPDLDRGWYVREAMSMINDLGLEAPAPPLPAGLS